MIDSILVFLAAWAISWPALVLFCIFGIWAEYSESRGFAVFWTLTTAVSAYFYFNVSIFDIGFYALGYLVAGVVWSFYRYKRFIVAKVESFNESTSRWDNIEQYHPSNMLDTITAWIIIWPFSLIENICGDIINGIESLVKGVFKGVYNKIYNTAVADAIRKNEGVN